MILKQKSEANYKAAHFLFENSVYYSASIHCSYYACLQLMKHILHNKYKVNYSLHYNLNPNNCTKKRKCINEQRCLNSIISHHKDKSSHQKIFNCFKTNSLNKISKIDFAKIDRRFKQLKDYRKQADYNCIEIFKADSETSYKLATDIIDTLKTI